MIWVIIPFKNEHYNRLSFPRKKMSKDGLIYWLSFLKNDADK